MIFRLKPHRLFRRLADRSALLPLHGYISLAMSAEHRPIRSFVLRQGRVSNAQRRAHDTLLPRFGIPFSRQTIDLDSAFGRCAAKILEIGFGMGDATAANAAQYPGNDYLGIEVHTPGVGSLLKSLDDKNLTNVRIIQLQSRSCPAAKSDASSQSNTRPRH